jgi:hypothetical protein
MAYMQEPGRAPLKNKKFEDLTNGTPLKQEMSNDEKEGRGKYSKNKKDSGGNYYSVDQTDGTEYRSTPSSRKFNADARDGTLAMPPGTRNVDYNADTKSYTPRPYADKAPKKQIPEYRKRLAKQGDPYAREEYKQFKRDSTLYMEYANRDVKKLNLASRRAQQ